jgi:hypothetical protein
MTTRCCPGHLRRTAGRLAPSGRGSRPERGAVKAPGHLPGPHTCPVPQVLGPGRRAANRTLALARSASAVPGGAGVAKLEAVGRLIVPESVFERCRTRDLRLHGSHEEG